MRHIITPAVVSAKVSGSLSAHLLAHLLAAMLAVPAAARADGLDADWVPVSAQRLEACRGGFELGNGLVAALNVERLVSINGNLVSSSRLNLDEMSRLSAAQAQAAQAAMAGQVIQNSASGQLIRSQTTITTTVNSLSLLKTLNFEGSLRDALSAAAGPR